jgi:hypothetical protein
MALCLAATLSRYLSLMLPSGFINRSPSIVFDPTRFLTLAHNADH